MAHVRPSFLSLPTELIEEIIIISAHLGDPRIVATLSQTCQLLRSLVYHQSHKHIWREMFLVIFDDPRPALDLHLQGRAPLRQPDPPPNDKGKGKVKEGMIISGDFPWEDEYKERIWTETFILRRARPPRSSDPPTTDTELCVALETLLRVISTAAPLPYDTIARHIPAASQCHPCGQSQPPPPHPVFSPLLVAAHTQPSLVLRSRNTSWLARVLAHGLPRALMARLTVFDEDGKVNLDVQQTRVEWDGLLERLVAQIGLMTPVGSTPCTSDRRLPHTVVVPCNNAVSGTSDGVAGESSSSSSSSSSTTTAMPILLENEDGGDGLKLRDGGNKNRDAHDLCGTSDDEDEDDDSDFELIEPEVESADDDSDEGSEMIDGDHVLGTKATSATIPQDGVRRLARIRVYNMAYLNPIHAFGPFLRLDAHHPRSSSTKDRKLSSGAVGGQELEDTSDVLGSPSSNASPPVPPIPDTNAYLSALAHADGSDIDVDGGESDDDNDERDGDANVSSSSEAHEGRLNGLSTSESFKGGPRHAQEMSGEQLRADWAWIAAARQVIEINLRDLLVGRHQGVLSALLSLEGLRACSAPGFPTHAPPEVIAVAKDDLESAFEDGEGWDWAGVEGQWRCVVRPDSPHLLPLSRVAMDLFRG